MAMRLCRRSPQARGDRGDRHGHGRRLTRRIDGRQFHLQPLDRVKNFRNHAVTTLLRKYSIR